MTQHSKCMSGGLTNMKFILKFCLLIMTDMKVSDLVSSWWHQVCEFIRITPCVVSGDF